RLAKAAVALQVDGQVRDLRLPVHEGEQLRIITDRDPEALAVLRHSTAHVMAEAVLHLWPDTKVAIGPAIADGFYYDFEFAQPISSDDLERIEQEMRRILSSEHPFQRHDGVGKAEILERIEEAKRRDHRRLGRELDLFHFADNSPGSPYWHPRGMVIWNELSTLWRELNRERGYLEVRTPIIFNVDVWKRSGHWEVYRENMYFTEVEAGEFGLKPMN